MSGQSRRCSTWSQRSQSRCTWNCRRCLLQLLACDAICLFQLLRIPILVHQCRIQAQPVHRATKRPSLLGGTGVLRRSQMSRDECERWLLQFRCLCSVQCFMVPGLISARFPTMFMLPNSVSASVVVYFTTTSSIRGVRLSRVPTGYQICHLPQPEHARHHRK